MPLNVSFINPLKTKQIKLNNQLHCVEDFEKLEVIIEPKFPNIMNVAFQVHIYLHFVDQRHPALHFATLNLMSHEYLVFNQGMKTSMAKTYDYGIKGKSHLLNTCYIGEQNKGNYSVIYFSANKEHDVIDLDALFNNIE